MSSSSTSKKGGIDNSTNRIKEDLGIVLKNKETGETIKNEVIPQPQPTKQEQPDPLNISKSALLKNLSSSAELSRQIDKELAERDRIQTELTSAKGMAYTGGNPSSQSSFWTPSSPATASATYSLHQEPSSVSGMLSKGTFESILLQERKQQQQQQSTQEQTKEQEQEQIKYFYGMHPPISQETLNQISKSLEPPTGFSDITDLQMNHQVRCPLPPCNGREIGYNRAVAREHIEGHVQFRSYRDRIRQTNQLWIDNSIKLFRLREQQQYLQSQISQTNKTLMMMIQAEDTKFLVEKLRHEQFDRAIKEGIHPQTIRNDRLSLGDKPLTENEKQWYESYTKEAGLPEGIPFDLALENLLSRRKAARYA